MTDASLLPRLSEIAIAAGEPGIPAMVSLDRLSINTSITRLYSAIAANVTSITTILASSGVTIIEYNWFDRLLCQL